MSDFINNNPELFELAKKVVSGNGDTPELGKLVSELQAAQNIHSTNFSAVAYMPVTNSNPDPYQKRKCLNDIVYAMSENAILANLLFTTVVIDLYPNNNSPYSQRLGDVTADYMQAADFYLEKYKFQHSEDFILSKTNIKDEI